MEISSLPHGCVGVTDRPMQMLDWFDTAARKDFDGVEVMDLWFKQEATTELNYALMTEVEKRLAGLPLKVSAFINHGPYVWTDTAQRLLDMNMTRFFMDWAVRLGTRIFRITTGVASEVFRDARLANAGVTMDVTVAAEHFRDMIEELLPYAKERGLNLALEEHPGFAGTIAKMEKLLELIPDPGFGIAFDMKNTLREGESPTDILTKPRFMDRVVYTHVDNFRDTPEGWDRSVTLQDGVVDIRRLVLGLKQHGYDGWLSIEYGGKNLDHVFTSAAWLRSVWNESLPNRKMTEEKPSIES